MWSKTKAAMAEVLPSLLWSPTYCVCFISICGFHFLFFFDHPTPVPLAVGRKFSFCILSWFSPELGWVAGWLANPEVVELSPADPSELDKTNIWQTNGRERERDGVDEEEEFVVLRSCWWNSPFVGILKDDKATLSWASVLQCCPTTVISAGNSSVYLSISRIMWKVWV